MQEWTIQPKPHYEVRNNTQLNSSVGTVLLLHSVQLGAVPFVDMDPLLKENPVLGSHLVLNVTPYTQCHRSTPGLVLQIVKIAFQCREQPFHVKIGGRHLAVRPYLPTMPMLEV